MSETWYNAARYWAPSALLCFQLVRVLRNWGLSVGSKFSTRMPYKLLNSISTSNVYYTIVVP